MAITQNDLEILKSEVMADTPDGGGLPTGIDVIDGVSNNLFPDVSDIDALEGRVRLRKVFPSVLTPSTDLLQASRVLITEIPSNPNASVFMFAATSFADRRTDAVEYMQSYTTADINIPMRYLGKQYKGVRSIEFIANNIIAIQNLAIGDVLLLTQPDGMAEGKQQYVKITSVVKEPYDDTQYESGMNQKLTIGFDQYLKFDFGQIETATPGVIFATSRPPDLRFYSASRLAASAVTGETSISLTSSNVRIAPSGISLSSEKVGVDLFRLPDDGLIEFVVAGDLVTITELKSMQLPTNAPNDTFDLGFERLSDVNVVDANDARVSFDYLDIDLDAGTLQLNGMFDMSGYTAPLTAKYRIMDLGKVASISDQTVNLLNPITHNYTDAAVFSTMLLMGDMQARAFNVFSQKSWTKEFSDQLIGDRAEAQLQIANNPIVVTNRDAIEERWALVFTSATAFRIVGETVGEIGTGSTTTLTAPINPMTGYPYFTIPVAAWSTGWSAANVVRLNTEAAKNPVWFGSAIQQHQIDSLNTYDFTIGYHANIDRVRGAA
ncbi:hypothetical protein Q6344_09115 [Psychrobacter cibarius]|nr:hypothetical protein Q6344_09115 [Psychrobacter cibarius]